MKKRIILGCLMIVSFLFFMACGHVETHRDYYTSESVRYQQHSKAIESLSTAQRDIYIKMLEYASQHPIVTISNPDGTVITVNQQLPPQPNINFEHISVPVAAAQPREAPGEKVLTKLVDGLTLFGVGYLIGDAVKSGFENSGHNVTTSTNAGGSINTVGGNFEIPTTTNTTTNTATTNLDNNTLTGKTQP